MNARLTAWVVLIAMCVANATAQNMKWNNRYQTYIDQYRDLAIEEMLRYKIPARDSRITSCN